MDPGLVFLAAAAIGAGYYVSIRLHPYKACGRCKKRRGKNTGSNRRHWGRCRACGGSGEKERLGVRLFFRRR